MAKMKPKMAKMKPKMAKIRPKLAKMRLKMAKLRPKMAKIRPKMAKMRPKKKSLDKPLQQISDQFNFCAPLPCKTPIFEGNKSRSKAVFVKNHHFAWEGCHFLFKTVGFFSFFLGPTGAD